MWGDLVQFVYILIRQAHPGPDAPGYRTMQQKMRDARRFQQEDNMPWLLLVDDLQGSAHQVYGGLANPTYLIDSDGNVAHYNMWTYAPGLHLAIEELVNNGGAGVVKGGIDHVPHLGASFAHGWRGLRRGLPQSLLELERSMPLLGVELWAGHRLRRLLEPWVIRSKPLPLAGHILIWSALSALVAGAVMFFFGTGRKHKK